MNRGGCDANVGIGHSTRQIYDDCAFNDKLTESVAPLQYRMNTNSIYNCQGCFSSFGPRSKYGVSMTVDNEPSVSQTSDLINIESILTNRNVQNSKCKNGQVNPINVAQFDLKHPRACKQFIDPLSSRLSDPSANYRDLSINRFYDLNRNPQKNIFWDFAANTSLEAKDNYVPDLPLPWKNTHSMPRSLHGCPKDTILRIKPPC